MTSAQLTNNIVRGAVQTVALHMAGVRAMEISAFDEAIRTPSRDAHIIGLRTQQVVAEETGIDDVADPLGGSYYVEALADRLEARIEERIRFIEDLDDVVALADQGFFRAIFAEAMVDRAREVDEGTRPVVGVNVHRMALEEDQLLRDLAERRIEPCYDIVDDVAAWKARRDMPAVLAALDDLERAGRDRDANVIPAVIAALEAEASMGECIGVLRETYDAPYDPLNATTRPGR